MEWLLIIMLPYMLVFLIISTRLQQVTQKASAVQKNHKPVQKLLSVVIPLKNEEDNIQNLLAVSYTHLRAHET